jgi:hypothetical protein
MALTSASRIGAAVPFFTASRFGNESTLVQEEKLPPGQFRPETERKNETIGWGASTYGPPGHQKGIQGVEVSIIHVSEVFVGQRRIEMFAGARNAISHGSSRPHPETALPCPAS